MDLSCSEVLQSLTEAERGRLLDHAVPRTLERGDALHIAGGEAERVHVVIQGMLKLALSDMEGHETIVALAGAGDLVGDVAVLDGYDQPVDVIALTPCALLGLDADILLDCLEGNGAAAVALARHLSARIRRMCNVTLERETGEVPARLAGRLLELAEMLGRMRGGVIELELPLAQADLARLSGMCRESASKTLSRFRREGLIDYRGRNLRIHRPDALERIRCAGRASAPSR